MPTLTSYQRYLHFLSTPHDPAPLRASAGTAPAHLTFLSTLRGALRLGLNFPASVTYALRLRLALAPGWLAVLRPGLRIDIASIPHDAQPSVSVLQGIDLDSAAAAGSQTRFTADDLIRLNTKSSQGTHNTGKLGKRAVDTSYIRFFHRVAAGADGLVGAHEVRALQSGQWAEEVAQRRRRREGVGSDVLPFSRGGPIGVMPHSWFVWMLFGVRVYEP